MLDRMGKRILTVPSRGIGNECVTTQVQEHAIPDRKILVPFPYSDRFQRFSPRKGRAVHLLNQGRKLNAHKIGAVFKCKVPNGDQPAVPFEQEGIEPYVIPECIVSDGRDTLGNHHVNEIQASIKGILTDMAQSAREHHLAKSAFTGKSQVTDARHNPSIDHIGNGNVSSLSDIGAYLNRAIVQYNVGKRNAIIFIDPVGVQRQIRRKRVGTSVVFLGTLFIVIPTVKNGIESFGLGDILQGMIAYEALLDVFQLIGEHMEGYRTTLFTNKCIHVKRSVAVEIILAQASQVIAGCIQLFLDRFELNILILRQVQRDCGGNQGRGQRRSALGSVIPAHQCCQGTAGSNKIYVLSIVRIVCKHPTIVRKGTDTEYVLIGGGIGQSCRRLIACGRNTDDVAVKGQLCRLGIYIGGTSKRHIHHGCIALNRIVQTEHKIRASREFSVRIALGLDHDNIDVGRKTYDSVAVHLRGDDTGYSGSVPLLIFDQGPIIRAVFKNVILYNLIFRGIVGKLADPTCKFGMIGINTRINDRNRNSRALGLTPRLSDIQVVQICLAFVQRIAHRIMRADSCSLSHVLALYNIGDSYGIIRRHFLYVCPIQVISIHVENGFFLGQIQNGKTTVHADSQCCPQLVCQLTRSDRGRIVQYDGMLVVLTLPFFKLGKRFCLDSLQLMLAMGYADYRNHSDQHEQASQNTRDSDTLLMSVHIYPLNSNK